MTNTVYCAVGSTKCPQAQLLLHRTTASHGSWFPYILSGEPHLYQAGFQNAKQYYDLHSFYLECAEKRALTSQ